MCLMNIKYINLLINKNTVVKSKKIGKVVFYTLADFTYKMCCTKFNAIRVLGFALIRMV